MESRPAFSIAVMNDLHIGGAPSHGFQNRFLSDDAGATVAATVASINERQPDLVLVPGDLTHNASEHELTDVLAHLNGLCCPFVACHGNHDRETPQSARRFDRALGINAGPGIVVRDDLRLPDDIAILVLESSWGSGGNPYTPGSPPLAVIDDGIIERALRSLQQRRPEWLLVVSHYPLVSQAAYVSANKGKYAGHVDGGENIMRELSTRAGAVVCFCGHNHYHHILTGARWLQCATGALAEYPAEYRLASIVDGSMTISTAAGAESIVEAAPAPDAPWVQGRPQDRSITWRPA